MEKAWWESTTLQGALISAIGLVITLLKSVLGVELLSTEETTSLVTGILSLIGIGMVIYGRLTVKPEGVKLGWKSSK